MYDISLVSKDVVLLPVTAEGPFPKVTDGTHLTTVGFPDFVVESGIRYMRFTIGSNICAQYSKLSAGTVLLSEERRELIVDGELSPSYRGTTNHSGRYSDIEVRHPALVDIDDESDAESLYGKYFFAVGRFENSPSLFRTHKLAFDTNGYFCMDESADYEVVGTIAHHYKKDSAIPLVHILMIKKAGTTAPTQCRR